MDSGEEGDISNISIRIKRIVYSGPALGEATGRTMIIVCDYLMV